MSYTKYGTYPKEAVLNVDDYIRVALYPDKFFIIPKDITREVDMMPKIYDERTGQFVIHSLVEGKVTDTFLNRTNGQTWVTIYNYFRGMSFCVPVYNVLEIMVSA